MVSESEVKEVKSGPSAADLVEESKGGADAIKNDWEKRKLKKRVDATEEGLNQVNDILDNLNRKVDSIVPGTNILCAL